MTKCCNFQYLIDVSVSSSLIYAMVPFTYSYHSYYLQDYLSQLSLGVVSSIEDLSEFHLFLDWLNRSQTFKVTSCLFLNSLGLHENSVNL
jgi:hypothetical protein